MGCLPMRVVLGLMETVQIRNSWTDQVCWTSVSCLSQNFWPWKAFFTTTNVYLARVNLNIAITAMVIEKQPQGNHSSVVCEREYELGTSSSELNSTLSGETEESSGGNVGRDTFDWTNRQSGLMLGIGASRTKYSVLHSWTVREALKRRLFLWIRSDDAVCRFYFSVFWCPENHDRGYVDFKFIQFCVYLYHHHFRFWVSHVTKPNPKPIL